MRTSRAVAQKGYGTPTPNFFEPRVASAKQGRGKLLFGEVAPSGGPGGIHGKAAFLLPSIAWLAWLGGLAGWLGWLAWPVGLAGWLSELGCRAGLSSWAVRLSCPSPRVAVWLAGWPGRLAGLSGLACPPSLIPSRRHSRHSRFIGIGLQTWPEGGAGNTQKAAPKANNRSSLRPNSDKPVAPVVE